MDEKDYLDSSAELNSDEAEKEEVITQSSPDEKEEETFDTTISGIGVNYENNDNWKFEAEALTLSDDFLEKSVDYAEDEYKENIVDEKAVESEPEPSKNGSNHIVISKTPLLFISVAIFVAACIALISVFSVRYFTVPNGKEGKYANPGSIVATVGDTKVTTGMFNYYYNSIFSYYEQYASYGYFTLDTSDDLRTQYTTDDEGNRVSWADFFVSEVFEEISRTAGVYSKAVSEGITVTKAQQATIDQQIESMKTAASEKNQSLDAYISSLYGEYCTEATLRTMLEQYYVSVNYSGYINSQKQPTDKEIDKYYSEHENEFKLISFSYLALTYDSTSDESKETSIKEANKYMDKITDRKSIVKMIPTVYADYIEADAQQIMSGDKSMTEKEAIKHATENYESSVDYSMTAAETPFDDETTNWLFDDNTKIGDKKIYINEEAGYIYVILKTENATADESQTYSVRHILIMPEGDESSADETGKTEHTDEQWAAAEKKANEILDTFNKGDKSEYSFALLAEEHSEDVASTSASGTGAFGGLCAATPLGQMVPEFEEWSVDKSRKYGDTGIVKSQYGYHIMFFVNNMESYKASVITAMRDAQINELIDGVNKDINQSKIDKAIARFAKTYAAKKATAASDTDAQANANTAE